MSHTDRAFYTLDQELRLLGASQNTLRMWGKTSAEITGRKLVDVFPFVEGTTVHHALREALKTFRPVRLRVNSVVLSRLVDVEIYPVHSGLQVSFVPAKAD